VFVLVPYIFSFVLTHEIHSAYTLQVLSFTWNLYAPAGVPSVPVLKGMLSTSPRPAKMFPLSLANDTGNCLNIHWFQII
jgi:hypothetical protein